MHVGLAPIRDLMASPDVLEIMVVNGSDVWVERTSGFSHHCSLSTAHSSSCRFRVGTSLRISPTTCHLAGKRCCLGRNIIGENITCFCSNRMVLTARPCGVCRGHRRDSFSPPTCGGSTNPTSKPRRNGGSHFARPSAHIFANATRSSCGGRSAWYRSG